MRRRITSLLLLTALLISMYNAVIPVKASAAKPGIVHAMGTEFVLDVYPFYFAGCNSYDLSTKSRTEINKRISSMATTGVKVLRNLGFSHEDWRVFEPEKGVYIKKQFGLLGNIKKSLIANGIFEILGGDILLPTVLEEHAGKMAAESEAPAPGSAPTPIPTPKLYGYIAPDFPYSKAAEPIIKEGFTIDFYGAPAPVKTDSRGYFEVNGTFAIDSLTYHVRISKPGYLTRVVEVRQGFDMQVSTADAPIIIWAGDVAVNGVQDNAINMVDVIEVAKAFNSSTGNSKYDAGFDFNKDNAVNMSDIVIITRHFNSSISSYKSVK